MARSPASAQPEGPDRETALGAKALRLLHTAMHENDSGVRVLAAEQWGPIGNATVAPMLRRFLEDPNAYVRIAAAGSLYELGDRSGVTVVEAIAANAPKPSGGDEVSSALDAMRAIARNKVRVTALRTLSLMGSASSLKVLQAAASDPDGAVRDAAAVALARTGDVLARRRFVKALEDRDPEVRLQAARALGQIGGESAIAPLEKLAQDSSWQVRAAVMEALGETGGVLALPALKQGIGDQNELVRAKAVAALGRIDSPSAVPLLEEAKQRASNAYVEMLAVAGLARLGQKVDMQVAQRALAQPDGDTRMLAVEALELVGRVAGKAAVENLDLALEDREPRVRVRAAAALVRLLQRKGAQGK